MRLTRSTVGTPSIQLLKNVVNDSVNYRFRVSKRAAVGFCGIPVG